MIGKKKIPNYYLFKDLSLNEIKTPLKDKYIQHNKIKFYFMIQI